MKISANILVILLIVLISCDKENPTEPIIQSDHIKHFGFTLIDTYWDDPTDTEVKTNYIDEVAEFSNIADILVVNPTDNIIERMTIMNDLQVKSILHLNDLFFEQVGTSSPSGVEYDLRSNYQERWNEFINLNQLQSNQGLIQCFYIGEEPTWNGINYDELKSATDFVKSTLPNVLIMIVEAYPTINQLKIPNSVDWIGFDRYFIKKPQTDVTFLSNLSMLKSKFSTTTQKLVLIMDAHYISSIHGDFGGIELNEMGEVANNYYELAKSEQKTIALLGYFWPSGFDISGSIGARNMPNNIRQNYIRIGKEITGK